MKRKHVPLSVKLAVALRQLGLDPKTAQLDHVPALALRMQMPDGRYIPDENNPQYLQWLDKEPHKVKTIGAGATTAGSDIGKIAHGRRLTKKEAAFRARLLAKDQGAPPAKSKWPKRGFR